MFTTYFQTSSSAASPAPYKENPCTHRSHSKLALLLYLGSLGCSQGTRTTPKCHHWVSPVTATSRSQTHKASGSKGGVFYPSPSPVCQPCLHMVSYYLITTLSALTAFKNSTVFSFHFFLHQEKVSDTFLSKMPRWKETQIIFLRDFVCCFVLTSPVQIFISSAMNKTSQPSSFVNSLRVISLKGCLEI